jgi:CheY-like chemotaxis protein/signal transduction histidine kinase
MERPDFNQWKAREVARLLALVESERRYYQEIVATLPIPLVVLSADRAAISANRAFRQAFQLRAEDVRRQSIDQLLPVPELAGRIQEAHARSAPAVPLVTQLGERTVRISVVPIRDWNDENALETLLIIEDLSDVVPAPTEAPAVVHEDLPAIVWQADVETLQFRSVAGAVEEMLGYPAAYWTGTPNFFEERIYAEDRPAVMALYRTAIDHGGDATAEFRAVSADGAMVWLRESIRVAPPDASTHSITGVITSIGRRKELESQGIAASRTEALQTLAGRLAHDLNNPLMIIAGYAEEMLASLAPDDPRRADVNQILMAANRVSETANQLIEFGRKHAQPATPVNLTQVFKTLEPSIAQAAGAGVSVEMIPPETDLWAFADAAQLAEVILALAGANEGSRDRTRLTVAWHADTLTESIASATLAPGRYSCIVLRDSGGGLGTAQRAALFEAVLAPGAVLSRAYQTVREWGGDIAVESGPAGGLGGNTFSIYLPYMDAPAVPVDVSPELPVIQVPPPLPEPVRETILVVDDEPGIRGLMRKILRRERYMVLEAGNAEEALAVALSHAGPIDLLLTDVMMPGLTGPELARRMCEAAPNLKVLYISGYAPEEALQPAQLAAGFAFLSKPFTLGALVSKVRDTLDSTAT